MAPSSAASVVGAGEPDLQSANWSLTETLKYDVYSTVNVGVISGRVDDDDESLLKEAGVNLSEVVRAAAHERARQLRQERALKWLTEHAVDVGTRAEDLVRAGRDA